MQLEMALHKLHADINCDELMFWGKITGKSISFDQYCVTYYFK